MEYDETWTEFEIALMETTKRLPPLTKDVNFDAPIKYQNGTTRSKAYIKMRDTVFYCPRCGMIPIMQQHPQTKLYRVCCPKCRIYAPEGAVKEKHEAYKKWNEFAKSELRK
ncbi:MAG: hypothetical protein ACI4EA_06245 [Candidatus Ornithomonoglobus sp.]